MKKVVLFIALVSIVSMGQAQDNGVILSGGYVFTEIQDLDQSAKGWRVNGTFEFYGKEGPLTHGISLGYISTSVKIDELLQEVDYQLSSLPVFYAPKYVFGEGNFTGYLKGALGMHFSKYKRTGGLGDLSTSDAGFYGGLALGLRVNVKENIFIHAEYEAAYLSNTFYRNGLVNTIMGGIGFIF